jgi:hypothetical protein
MYDSFRNCQIYGEIFFWGTKNRYAALLIEIVSTEVTALPDTSIINI